jgi:hypothetical protein
MEEEGPAAPAPAAPAAAGAVGGLAPAAPAPAFVGGVAGLLQAAVARGPADDPVRLKAAEQRESAARTKRLAKDQTVLRIARWLCCARSLACARARAHCISFASAGAPAQTTRVLIAARWATGLSVSRLVGKRVRVVGGWVGGWWGGGRGNERGWGRGGLVGGASVPFARRRSSSSAKSRSAPKRGFGSAISRSSSMSSQGGSLKSKPQRPPRRRACFLRLATCPFLSQPRVAAWSRRGAAHASVHSVACGSRRSGGARPGF